MRVEHLSASRIDTYLKCPHRYYIEYELERRQESEALNFGHLIHSVFERLFQGNYENPIEDGKKLFGELWSQGQLRDISYFKLGQKVIEDFFRKNDYFTLRQAVYQKPEYEFNIPINDGEISFILTGRIDLPLDRGEGILEIVDFKTSVLPKSTFELEEDVQMNVYYYAAQKLFPEFKKIRLTLYYLRYDQAVTVERVIGEDVNFISWFEDFLRATYRQILNDQTHNATPNEFCAYCIGRKECNYVPSIEAEFDTLRNANISETSSITELLKQYDKIRYMLGVLEQKEEEIKEVFKKILTSVDSDCIKYNSRTISLRNNPKTVYNPVTVYELLGPEKFFEVVEVRKQKVDKIVGDNQELLKKLRSTAHINYGKPYVVISNPRKNLFFERRKQEEKKKVAKGG